MIVQIEFQARIPEEATEDEINEWIRFELRDNGVIQTINPLEKHILEPIFGTLTWRAI